MAAEKTQEIKWTKRKQCAAMNCNNYQCTSSECAFHRFPKDPQRCAKWVHNLKNASLYAITSDQLHRTYRVCSAHFHISQFKRPSDVHAGLKWDAVPTEIDAPDPPPPLDVKKRKPPKTHQELLCKKSKQSHVPPPSKEQYTEEAVAGPSSVEEGDVEDVLAEPSSVHTAAVGEQSHTMKISALKTQVSSQEPIMKYKEKSLCSLMNIKDEPTDEDYDKALIPQSDISVKEDPENEDHETLVPDELRITSVFSVEGDSDVSGLTSAATAAQAPLSLSKDMPVIGGVVSLASALSGNTALTGAFPTFDDSSEIIDDGSTQTDSSTDQHQTTDESEDESEITVKPEPDASLESDSEMQCEDDSSQEAEDEMVWVEQTAGKPRGRLRECSIMSETPGPTCHAKDNITSPLSSLLCLIDAEMWEKIQKCTEAEADQNKEFTLTTDELKAFVGLIYLRGITGGKIMKLDEYWSTDLGNPTFIETLGRQKFRDIMRYLSFDDKTTRAARLAKDKFALISEIFDKFVKNSIASFTPGENINVDEQLFSTKARCRFTQYVANKPGKFGIKFWVAADAETKYILNAIPYLGKDGSTLTGRRLTENVVLHLVEPFLGKGRNITTDYTSFALADKLLKRKTTIVGEVNNKRRNIPPCAEAQCERFSSKVLRSGKVTITIYQADHKKNMCIMSTKHQRVLTDGGAKKVPETVLYYNSTKGAVEEMDQMVRLYSVKRGTRRWPLAIFYNLLDRAAINAHVLYKQCKKVNISRRKFILELVKELCAKQKVAKALAAAAAAAAAAAQKRLLADAPLPPAKRKQCQIGRCSGNKTFDICHSCKRFVCGKCTKVTPKLCYNC